MAFKWKRKGANSVLLKVAEGTLVTFRRVKTTENKALVAINIILWNEERNTWDNMGHNWFELEDMQAVAKALLELSK